MAIVATLLLALLVVFVGRGFWIWLRNDTSLREYMHIVVSVLKTIYAVWRDVCTQLMNEGTPWWHFPIIAAIYVLSAIYASALGFFGCLREVIIRGIIMAPRADDDRSTSAGESVQSEGESD